MSKPSILIVDDEFSIVETLSDILSWEGYEVLSAANGEAALKLLDAGARPSLILLDYMMPVMDGLQTLGALRARPDAALTPVVLMTAAPLGLRGRDRTWNTLLVKPFDAQQLLRTVKQLITMRDPPGEG